MVFCLKQGRKMNGLKGSGFEGLSGTPLPVANYHPFWEADVGKLPLSVNYLPRELN